MDDEAAQAVLVQVQHGKCAGAVKLLNKGIADKQPSVILMAGSMFETGLCVTQDWERAVNFYQMADAAGRREALPRLVSGYAEKNRDSGATMWWLTKVPNMPAKCTTANHLAGDPDAFVAALNKWPNGQVAACVYTGGVVMHVIGDIEFPARGAQQGVFGDAVMTFIPATGTITWKATGIDRVSVTRQVQVGKDDRSVFEDTFLKHMRAVGDRSLTQFTRPDGIDPAWKVEWQFKFVYGD